MAELNFRNRTLYHGDNLAFLRGMNSETVRLIATDPPFNKNRDFHATPDSLARGARFRDRWRWDEDVHEEWTDGIIDDWPAAWEVITAARAAYGDDMGAFLCWLGVRLMEMHRVLKPDGSLYLHCDPTASHYIKALLDAIFGWKNFRNEIVWKYKYGGRSKKWFGRKHDIILFYIKTSAAPFNLHDVRVPHEPDSLEMNFTKIDKAGRRYREGTWKSGKKYRYYADEGRTPDDVWTDINAIHPSDRKRTGYPTEKPLALYRRIIAASSNEGDIVLDPFCGCATTPIAAEQLGRQWVGMDIWDKAHETVLSRLAEEGMLTAEQKPHQFWSKIVHYEAEPPIRTDESEVAAPALQLPRRRALAPWQRLTHRQMRHVLAKAQQSVSGVICAGCGRVLEREFMQLDHITPKADRGENHILNRILLCGPCNRRKRDYFTLRGLMRENRKRAVGWMQDESRALLAQDDARKRAEWLRDNFDSAEARELISAAT